MGRDRRPSLKSGAGLSKLTADDARSSRPGRELARGGALFAAGDGTWIHDTQTDPPSRDERKSASTGGAVERDQRIEKLESELARAKREIEELRMERSLDFFDEPTLPRIASIPPARAVTTARSGPAGSAIPRLPPRPAPLPALVAARDDRASARPESPATFGARGTLTMAPLVTELPLPPAARNGVLLDFTKGAATVLPNGQPPSPGVSPSLELFAFEPPPSAPQTHAGQVTPARSHTWLFALLALASSGLAFTGFLVITDPGSPATASGSTTRVTARSAKPSAPHALSASSIPSFATTTDTPRVAATSVDGATSAAASAVAMAAPPMELGAASEASPRTASSVDAGALLSFQGYLTVHSSSAAEVVVQGISAGQTNEPLLVRCGPKNVRLRDGARWITEGRHVHVDCMLHTEVTIAPSSSHPD